MVNGSNGVPGKTLQRAFESGFSNAAASLSQLANTRIFYNNFHHGHYTINSPLDERYQRYNAMPRILLKTDVFGDVSGKSYLYLSLQDFELLTHAIPDRPNSELNLQEEFIKETDNILSAAVITKLSNELNVKMFGDVPMLIGKITSKLEETISDDFEEHADEVFINSIFFSFEKHPNASPLFVWVFDKSLTAIRHEKETAGR